MTQAQIDVNQDQTSEHLKAEVHYRLTHEEFLTWIEKHNLKWSEVKLYLYFCTLNPFGDREIEFSPDLLYSQLKIKKSAFYSAAARLEKLGLLSLKVLRAAARIHPINRTTFHLNGKSSNKSESRQPEASPDKDCGEAHTYSDYSNFKHTLSEGEREQFEKFVRIEWKKLTAKNGEPGEEIVSLERFLSCAEDTKNWHQRFLNSPAGEEVKKSSVASTDWTQHPEWSDWLAIMREGVPRFVALGTCFDNKTRRAIADWADERGLIWGNES